MTNFNTKSRILISVILIASTLGVFIYAQGADLTLDSVLGVYNARWLNGTDAALSTGLYVDLIDEYSAAAGVTIDGVVIKDRFIFFQSNGMPAYTEGQFGYDNSEGSLFFDNIEPEVRLQIGQESWLRVRNDGGSTIEDGQAVYISGVSGGIPQISLAQANAIPQALAVGLSTHDIENGTIGFVTIAGTVRDINTSMFSTGDLLFLSPSTPGGLINTQPSDPNFRVQMGYVTLDNDSGKILVETNIFGDVTSIRNAIGATSAFGSDNILIRSDGTGKTVQSTGITIDDLNNMTGVSTIDTGQGANELYDMDQNVLHSSTPTFAGVLMQDILDLAWGTPAIQWNETDKADPEGLFQMYLSSDILRIASRNAGDLDFETIVQFDRVAEGGTTDFLNNPVENLGTSGNDFGATNDLVETDFSGNIQVDKSSPLIILDGDTGTNSEFRLEENNVIQWTIFHEASSGDLIIRDSPNGVNRMRIRDGAGVQDINFENADINTAQNIVTPGTNNTGAIGEDTVRFADGYFVTVTAKNTVTGKIIENEIKANPFESFEEGDLVQILDTRYFTKTTNKLANVIGVVTLNPGNIQIGTETVTSWIDEVHDVTRSVSWVENVTDAYGQVYEVERTREEPVTEWYLEMVEETLSDGNTVLYYENRTRIKTETVQIEVTTETPVMGPKNEPVLCVFGGPTLVKISEPVLKHDVLVASAVDGKARPLRTVLPELVEQFGDMEMNFENVLMAIEKLNYKTLGRVMEDSTGDTCWAMIGY